MLETATCIVCGRAGIRGDEFNINHRLPLHVCSELCVVRWQLWDARRTARARS